MSSAWPRHATEVVPWRPLGRAGRRADRELREVEVAIPPRIAGRPVPVDAPLLASAEEATAAIARLDSRGAGVLAPLALVLLRTESVASSKIERIEASTVDYLRAEHGIRSNDAAVAMVAGTRAVDVLLRSLGPDGRIGLDAILEAHAVLVGDDPMEQPGQLRTVQNWIGGSDFSPIDALYVPPSPERLPAAIADLLDFVDGRHAPALVQAAVAHAQFESIHPFVDGNGRIGRGLVNVVLRSRGITTEVVVPIASALVAHRDRYFDALTAYRRGDIEPIVSRFVGAAQVAAGEASESAVRLSAAIDEMHEQVGARRGSAAARLLEVLPAMPVVTADDVVRLADVSASNAYGAIERLVDAGVLRPLTDRKRDQIWGTVAIIEEVERLGNRIARRAVAEGTP